MDEAEFIGLGNYRVKHGIENRMDILLRHLNRVSEIAKKYDYELLMWGDMFYKLTGNGDSETAAFDATLKEKIPSNVTLVYWDYYSTEKAHLTYSRKTAEAAMRSCREQGVKSYFTTLWSDDGGECSRFSALPELCWALNKTDSRIDNREVYNRQKRGKKKPDH